MRKFYGTPNSYCENVNFEAIHAKRIDSLEEDVAISFMPTINGDGEKIGYLHK